jgi:hypothetical protein
MGGNITMNNNNIDSTGILTASTINATTRFIPPVMTTSDRNALTSVANGTTVYDSTLNTYMVYNTTLSRWQTVGQNTSMIDLTSGSTTLYYPIILNITVSTGHFLRTINFEVSSTSSDASATINNNILYGSATGGGWSDNSPNFDVYFSQYNTQLNEDAILGIYRGTEDYYGICLYLAGGVSYNIRSNADIVVGAVSSQTINNSIFAIKNSSGVDQVSSSAKIAQLVSFIGDGSSTTGNIGRHIYNSVNVYTPGTTTPTIRLNPTSSSQMPLLGIANTPSTSNGTVLDVNGNVRVRNNIFLHAFDGVDRGIFFRGNTSSSVFEAGGVSRYNLSITTYDDSGGGSSADGLSINAYDGIRFLTNDSTTPKLRINRTGEIFIGATQIFTNTGAMLVTAGAIGSYALLIHKTLNAFIVAGVDYAGSNFAMGYTVNLTGNTDGGWYPRPTGTTMSGTWRALSSSQALTSGDWNYGGLFQRTA